MHDIRVCHHDTQGLYNDYLILHNVLSKLANVIHCVYSEIQLVKNTDVTDTPHCKINIFIEHIYEAYIKYADVNIYIPNLEWCNKNDQTLVSRMNAIFCKTDDSYRTLQNAFPRAQIFNIGFTSIDRFSENVHKNNDYCLHLKGISKYKNSQVLIDTWLKHPNWPTLVVVHYGVLHFNVPFKVGPNIIVYQCKLNDITLQKIMNQCAIHICCSFSEGFGHYINEARSVGGYIVTTDGEPMRSFVNNGTGSLIKTAKSISLNYGTGYYLHEDDITATLNKVFSMNKDEIKAKGEENRKNFLIEKMDFNRKMIDAIKIFI